MLTDPSPTPAPLDLNALAPRLARRLLALHGQRPGVAEIALSALGSSALAELERLGVLDLDGDPRGGEPVLLRVTEHGHVLIAALAAAASGSPAQEPPRRLARRLAGMHGASRAAIASAVTVMALEDRITLERLGAIDYRDRRGRRPDVEGLARQGIPCWFAVTDRGMRLIAELAAADRDLDADTRAAIAGLGEQRAVQAASVASVTAGPDGHAPGASTARAPRYAPAAAAGAGAQSLASAASSPPRNASPAPHVSITRPAGAAANRAQPPAAVQ